MTTERHVTESDFRLPEYRNADPKDYEFRHDGKLVRKDRWETGMFSIASALGMNMREGFEINDVVDRVRALVKNQPKDTASADEEPVERYCNLR